MQGFRVLGFRLLGVLWFWVDLGSYSIQSYFASGGCVQAGLGPIGLRAPGHPSGPRPKTSKPRAPIGACKP